MTMSAGPSPLRLGSISAQESESFAPGAKISERWRPSMSSIATNPVAWSGVSNHRSLASRPPQVEEMAVHVEATNNNDAFHRFYS